LENVREGRKEEINFQEVNLGGGHSPFKGLNPYQPVPLLGAVFVINDGDRLLSLPENIKPKPGAEKESASGGCKKGEAGRDTIQTGEKGARTMSDQDADSLNGQPPAAPGTGAGDGNGAPPDGGTPSGAPAAPPDPNAWPDDVPQNVRDAVQKRIDAMSAKSKALEDQIEQMRSNPAQPAKSAEGGEGGEESRPFASYETWKGQALGNDPKAIALFDGFQQAMMADLDRAVVAYVTSQLAPLQTGFSSSEKDAFYRSNPAAKSKEREIEAELSSMPGLTREKAWRIVNYGAALTPPRPPKAPPPGQKPGASGAPSGAGDLPRGKGIGALVEAVAASKGL
jgi:hypothetical protein